MIMSEPTVAPVVQPPVAPVEPEAKPVKDTVAYETHQKLLGEKKKLQERLDAIEAERRQKEEEELTKKGELQKILELREKEAKELREKLQAKEEREQQARKLSAVLKGLGGSVDEKWFSVIGQEIDQVLVNDQGEIEQMSVTSVVENLKKLWPEMTRRPMPGMPNENPAPGSLGKIARSEWLKLSSKEMTKWKPDQIVD